MTPTLRAGRWLFQVRSWAPLPLLAAELLLGEPIWWIPGLLVTAAGEGIRIWAVGHIGPRSRTRGDDTWGVIDTGPYGRVRNPLYLGNVLMFVGVGLVCGPIWGLAWAALLAAHYTLIVGWEESNLSEQLGAPYLDYLSRVPRWLPMGPGRDGGRWSLGVALKSERSTLLAILVVYGILAARLFVG